MAYLVYEPEKEIKNETVADNIRRILNQTYRLLPLREEKGDWNKPLETLIIEVSGLFYLIPDDHEGLRLLSKMQGLKNLGSDLDIKEYRRCIFECCSLLNAIEKKLRSKE